MTHYYQIYDIDLAASFPIPELYSTVASSTQLKITNQERIPVFEQIDREGWMYEDFLHVQIGPAGLLLLVKDVCRIWFKTQYTLVLEPLPGVDLAEAKIYLLGSGLSIYLMNQGLFSLHAGTVTNGQYCISFMGESGVGKSTTSTYFIDQGFRLLADDVTLVKIDAVDKQPRVWPAMPSMKLWPDSVQQLQRNPSELALIAPSEDKRRLNVSYAFEPSGNLPLKAIFLLEPSDQVQVPQVQRLQNKDSFTAIASNVYRAEAVPWLKQTANHFRFCSHLAQQVPVFRLQRPYEPFDIDSIYQLVNQTVAAL
jgi:hypothetical protein